jgi:hypothetical protein
MDAAAAQAMAKRNDVSVKMDPDAVRVARNVATYHEKSLAEYLSEIVLERASTDWQAIMAKEQQAGTTKPKGKGGSAK